MDGIRAHRSVIHLNITNFAVEVERVCDSSLQGRPVIVAPLDSPRTPVYDMSTEAYAEGVRKGMALGRARRLCHSAVIIRPRFDMYGRAVRAIFEKVQGFSPLVEMPDNNGHIFADVTGSRRLLGSPVDIARQIRKMVQAELRLCPSWSVAPNKLVAKVAVRLVNPVGECVVEAGQEASFLAPLSIHLLPGLVPSDLSVLREFHFCHIGQVAQLSMAQLAVLLGGNAKYLYWALRGEDSSVVQLAQEQECTAQYEHLFLTPVNDLKQFERVLFQLSSQAGQKLRGRMLAARRVGVLLEYKDGAQVIRQADTRFGCCYDPSIFALAQRAFMLAWRRSVGVTRLAVRLDRFSKPSSQQIIFADVEVRRQEQKRLFDALDRIRVRCGEKSISFGKGLH